jgi:hypothetical protein
MANQTAAICAFCAAAGWQSALYFVVSGWVVVGERIVDA